MVLTDSVRPSLVWFSQRASVGPQNFLTPSHVLL